MPILDPSALFTELNTEDNRILDDGIEQMLRIDIESANSVATLVCSGWLVLGVETETLRTMVQSRKEKTIRIDLSAVEKVDASGLGLLVELQAWSRETNHNLVVSNPSDDVWRLVILTKLYDTLEISDDNIPELVRRHDDFDRNELIA